MLTRRTASALLLFMAAPAAFAQGTITSGGASYALTASHFDTSPETNFTGVGTGDYLFESGWWFRIEGDTAETVFPAPTTQNYTGDTATINWTNLGGRNFNVTKTHVLTSAAAGQGEVATTLTVTNTSAQTITLHLFHMNDFDVNGSAAGDSAVSVDGNPNYIRINDATTGQAEYRAPGAVGHLVLPFAAASDVAAQLSNATVTNFTNTGLPFGPGDITAGFQWTLVLGPGQPPPRPGEVDERGGPPPASSATIRVFQAGNTTATPVSLQKFQVD
jgi:hypothetical protein